MSSRPWPSRSTRGVRPRPLLRAPGQRREQDVVDLRAERRWHLLQQRWVSSSDSPTLTRVDAAVPTSCDCHPPAARSAAP